MIKVLTILIMLLASITDLYSQEFTFKRFEASIFHDLVFSDADSLDRATLIDVRTREEFDAGHIKGAVQIDFYDPDFAKELQKLPKENAYLIYCRTGRRTRITLKLMEQLGFRNVADLKNGIVSWRKAGYKIVEN